MKIPVKRVMMRNDCPVQTLPGSPHGQHSEHHHVADASLSILFDTDTGCVYFSGWGTTRVTHITGVRELDFLPEPPPQHQAQSKK